MDSELEQAIIPAINTFTREVAYSNAVPDWYSPRQIDVSHRAETLKRRIEGYLKTEVPKSPFKIAVPRANGSRPVWVVPAINDQIILQACVSTVARKLEAIIDRRTVFSYQYNDDPNATSWMTDQCVAWRQFEQAGRERAAGCSQHVLVVDIAQSSATIRQDELFAFLSRFSAGSSVQVLRKLISAFAASGLPLINNSTFMLSNAYFTRIDELLKKKHVDMIRYHDDYCIFGKSSRELEAVYSSLHYDLERMGLKLNDEKTRLLTSDEYCDRLTAASANLSSRVGNSEDDEQDGGSRYVSVHPDVVTTRDVLTSVNKTFDKPDLYFNDGLARAQLGALRKLRDSHVSNKGQLMATATDANVVKAAVARGRDYLSTAGQEWRAIWILYFLQGLDPRGLSSALRQAVDDTFKFGQNSAPANVVKYWAHREYARNPQSMVEDLANCDYLEAGKRCFG